MQIGKNVKNRGHPRCLKQLDGFLGVLAVEILDPPEILFACRPALTHGFVVHS